METGCPKSPVMKPLGSLNECVSGCVHVYIFSGYRRRMHRLTHSSASNATRPPS